MNIAELNRLIFAPDNDTGGGTATLEPPMTLEVPEIPMAGNHPEPEEVKIPETKLPGVQGPKEAFGEDSELEMENMQADMTGKPRVMRDPVTGKFIPKDKKPEEAKAVEKTDKPVVKAEKPVKAAKAPVKPTEPATISKFKIGDQEKTPEEWAAHFKELEKKATEAAKPATSEPAKPTPATVEPDENEIDSKFIADATAKYLLPDDQLDIICSSGAEGAKKLAECFAAVELNTRKAMTQEFNRVLAERDGKLSPVLQHHQQIADYQRDQGFLEANPDIKTHPSGYQTYKQVENEIRDGYNHIRTKIQQGTATPVETAWATIHDNQTPEQFATDLAAHTRGRLAALPAPTPAPVAAAPVPAKPRTPAISPAATKPFNGDRPGGGNSTPKGESEQARQLREMEEWSGR